MIRANRGQSGIIGLAMALVLLFSTGLTCTAATSARTVLQYTSSLSRSICDWLCASAYAASKGNPPVAYWRFDEGGGGIAYDSSGSGNSGTLNAGAGGTNTAVGQMWTRQGKIGSALELDGTDDTVTLPASVSFNVSTSYTVELWFKQVGNTGTQILFATSGGGPGDITLGVVSGVLGYEYGGRYADTSTGKTITTGQWYHAVITWDTVSNIKVYLNGVQVASKTDARDYAGSWNRLGTTYPGNINYFNGLIDDVRVYDYARTSDQIMVDYNAGMAVYSGAGTDPNEGNSPVGYWPLDENTGTTAYDKSGNGNNGTITNAAWALGKYGSSLYFDENGDYADLGTGNILTNNISDISICAWVQLDAILGTASDNYEVIGNEVYQASGYLFRVENTLSKTSCGNIHFRFSQAGASTAITAPSNSYPDDHAWHHLAAVKNGSTGIIYLDGKQIYTAGDLSNPANATQPTRIGGLSQLWNGKLDEVKVYNYARTQAQIAYDYNKGKPVAQYKFDEGGGTIAHNEYSTADTGAAPVGWWRMDNNWNDASGNGNNGTANGGVTFSSSGKIGPYAGSFDGVDDYVSFSSINAKTQEGWFYFTQLASVKGINNFLFNNFYQHSANNMLYLVGTNDYIGWAPSINTWYHLVLTYTDAADTNTGKLYVNGTPYSVNQQPGSHSISAVNTISQSGQAFKGLIDDVRIYNYTRTAEQIYNDYKTTHGTLVGDTKFVDGKIGKALQFDGTGDYVIVNVDSWIRKVDYVTITGWYYHNGDTTAAPWGVMTNTGGGNTDGFWWHIKYPGNVLYLRTEDNVNGESDGTGTSFVSAGSWYFLATVIGTNKFDVYKDGALYWAWTPNSNFSWANINSDTAYFFIGKSYIDDVASINGKLDDVKLYSYARTVDQIKQDYNAGFSARFGAQSAGTADPWGGAMPVGWWKLDENTGVLAQDASGNGSNGTLYNSPVWTQGKLGSALSFNGSNTYVDTGYKVPAGARSYFIWVKYSSLNGPGGYSLTGVQEGGAYTYVGIQNGGQGYFYAGNNGGTFNYTFTTGQWYHVGFTMDGTNTTKIYVNGMLADTKTYSADATATLNFLIGKVNGGQHNVSGVIDDVRIYNYTLTPAQVAWLYNKGKPIAYWRFDETSGTTCYDDSGNANTGTAAIGATGTQTTIAAARTNGATGKYGKCMSFDGTDDVVDCGNISALNFGNNPFSLSVWFKNVSPSGYDTIAGKGGFWANDEFQMYTLGGNLRFYVNKAGAQYDVPYTISANQWYHAVGTYDGSYIKLYVNGVFRGQTAVNNLNIGNTTSFRIGNAAGDPFNGIIDDVRVYNYARTADQVAQDYNQGMAAKLGD